MRGKARSHLTYANVMATTAVFLVLGGGAFAAKSLTTKDGTITACVTKGSGEVRIAGSGKKCPRGTREVKWNQTGPPGAAGAPGQAGPVGPPGAPGAEGPTGDAGSARGYAHVSSGGTLISSKNVTGVRRECAFPCAPIAGVGAWQCLGLTFEPEVAVATTALLSTGTAARVEVSPLESDGQSAGCPPGFADVRVFTFGTDDTFAKPAEFFILLN